MYKSITLTILLLSIVMSGCVKLPETTSPKVKLRQPTPSLVPTNTPIHNCTGTTMGLICECIDGYWKYCTSPTSTPFPVEKDVELTIVDETTPPTKEKFDLGKGIKNIIKLPVKTPYGDYYDAGGDYDNARQVQDALDNIQFTAARNVHLPKSLLAPIEDYWNRSGSRSHVSATTSQNSYGVGPRLERLEIIVTPESAISYCERLEKVWGPHLQCNVPDSPERIDILYQNVLIIVLHPPFEEVGNPDDPSKDPIMLYPIRAMILEDLKDGDTREYTPSTPTPSDESKSSLPSFQEDAEIDRAFRRIDRNIQKLESALNSFGYY